MTIKLNKFNELKGYSLNGTYTKQLLEENGYEVVYHGEREDKRGSYAVSKCGIRVAENGYAHRIKEG